MEANKKSRFVKIKAARGYGDDIFGVKGYNSGSDVFTLQRLPKDGGGTTGCIKMYRAHCYIDRDTIKASQRQS